MLNRGVFILFILLLPFPALSFQAEGCGAEDYRDCHNLSRKEVAALLQSTVTEVVNVKCSQNIALAKELYHHPTLIMPDGRVLPGYKKVDEIVEVTKSP